MQNEVAEIKSKLAMMEADLQKTRHFIDSLRNQKNQCEKRLENAESLLNLLSDEGKRWEQNVRTMQI